MRTIAIAAAAACLLAGCAPQVAVANLTTDQAIIASSGDDDGRATMALAKEACAIHKRTAIPISRQCLDQWCFQKRVLFACKAEESQTPSSPPSGR